ncbi:hypothetical protein [Acidovorax sp.]|uniref:hypothetical protein n=1 Tax=Acidovorax sp. TaxID=1872122 RepID=UPI002ACEC0FD|nr:hypothetical protein [Acidovorax sp.]
MRKNNCQIDGAAPLQRAASDTEGGVAALAEASAAHRQVTGRPQAALPEAARSRRAVDPEALAARLRRAEQRVLGEVRREMAQDDQVQAQAFQELLHKARPQHGQKRLGPAKVWVPAAVAVFFVFGGVALEMVFGSGFIFLGSGALYSAMPWLLGILLALFAWGVYRLERSTGFLEADVPTWSIRWLIMYPFVVLLCASAVFGAPWGWAAFLGWSTGVPVREQIRVVWIETPRDSDNCGQSARVEFRGSTARICVEGLMEGAAPRAGDTVGVSGLISSYGLLVTTIHTR